METIPELITDFPHRKALGKGFLEDSFTLALFYLHFKGQHFLWWKQCIFFDCFFFTGSETIVYYAIQEIRGMGPEEQNATSYHKSCVRTVGFGVSVTRQICYTEFLCPILLGGAGVQRSGEAPEQ